MSQYPLPRIIRVRTKRIEQVQTHPQQRNSHYQYLQCQYDPLPRGTPACIIQLHAYASIRHSLLGHQHIASTDQFPCTPAPIAAMPWSNLATLQSSHITSPAQQRPNMPLMSQWWLLPLLLFVLPLIVALVFNKVFRHRNGISQNWVLALLVTACWLSALVIILRQVL